MSSPVGLFSKDLSLDQWFGELSAIQWFDSGFNVVSGISSGKLKYYNGSAFAEKPLKYWNGSAWVEKPLKYWNGSAWGLA
jgi:hypothetical protein